MAEIDPLKNSVCEWERTILDEIAEDHADERARSTARHLGECASCRAMVEMLACLLEAETADETKALDALGPRTAAFAATLSRTTPITPEVDTGSLAKAVRPRAR